MPSKKRTRLFGQIVGLGMIVAALLVLALMFVDVPAVWQALRRARLVYVGASSLFLLAGLACFAARWRFLLQGKPGFWHTFHAGNIGHAGNILLPGRVGEPGRIVVMGRDGTVSYAEATSSFVVERLFEQIMRLMALITAVALGSGLNITPGTMVTSLLFLAVMFMLIFWLVRNREMTRQKGTAVLSHLPRVTPEKAGRWLDELLDNLQYVASLRRAAQVIGWSLLSWGCFWVFFYFTLLALGSPILPANWLPMSMGALALSPPSAATQPGLFHGSVVIPLAAVGYDIEMLTAYTILLHIIEMFWMVLLAIWGLAQTGLSVSAVIRHG